MLAAIEKLDVREFKLLLLGLGLALTSIAVVTAFVPKIKQYQAATKTVAVLEDAQKSSADLDQQIYQRHANIDELKYRLHGDMADLPLKQV